MIQNLMLIDDDEDDREIFLTIVEDSFPDFSLSIATNGREAVQKLQNSSNPPDIIFLDLNMPLMNGRQFMQAIKTDINLQQIPIAILSTSSDNKTRSDMEILGANYFITKPDKYSAWKEMLSDFFLNSPL